MMKRTRDDDFLNQSSVYDNDSSSSESGEFHRRSNSPPERKHFCVICNKQFSSGKAYGGHVRIHSIEFSNKGKTKKTKRKNGLKEKDLIRADVESNNRCCLCGKEFLTIHSLFGHMRRHPDRSWKGIRPPEKSKSSFLDDDDDVMNRSMMMIDVTDDVHEAAYCLMMLRMEKPIETPNSEVTEKRDG